MDVAGRIAALAEPAAESAGLVVDGVEVAAAGNRTRVLVTLDLPETEIGSASLDAIAEASRGIGAALDDANVPSTPYVLEVSTPGTDRPLTELRHFLRARSRKVGVVLHDGSSVEGRLVDVDRNAADALLIDRDGSRTSVPFADVATGRIIVELTRSEE